MNIPFRKLRPETAYWILTGGRALLSSMIFTASVVYQINRVGLSPLQLVLVGTTLELSVLLFEVPTGVVADVYSRRLSILIGLALIGLGFLVEGALPFFAAILLAQVLWGVGHTFTSGATQAWIVDEVGEAHAGRLFLRGAQVEYVCDLVGIGLGAALGSLAVNLPILAGGAGFIVMCLGLAFVMPEHNFQPAAKDAAGDVREHLRAMAGTLRESVRLVRVHPALLTIFGIGLFYGLYSEGYDRLSTVHLLKDITLPAVGGLQPVAWIALIKAAGTLVTLAATEVIKRRLNTQNTAHVTRALLTFSALLVGCLTGFALAGNFGVGVMLMMAIGTLRNLIGPLYDTWINQRLDSRVRATVISMSGQVDAIGQIAGGPGVGWIGSAVSVRAALLTSAAILAPVLALYLRARAALQPAEAAPLIVEAE
jgi:DHA3 family tetracycline resistance protein-like MFS transporter